MDLEKELEKQIEFYNKRLPLIRLKAEYAKLNRDIAVNKAEEFQATVVLSQLSLQHKNDKDENGKKGG